MPKIIADDYGKAAVDSVNEFNSLDEVKNPIIMMQQIWRKQSSALTKGNDCPKSTFLGLCSAGYVFGIPAFSYTDSVKNRFYGESAVNLLKAFPALAHIEANDLWKLVTSVLTACSVNVPVVHNYRMDVVLGLWRAGLIVV